MSDAPRLPLEPIAVTVLSGFLGSGKTTLLNALLRQRHDQKVAVIVNEFGSVGIDGALVAGGERFVTLDNGCLCCALNEDLQGALAELVAMSQHGTGPIDPARPRQQLDRIVIESTGLADPLPVAWTCTRPELSKALRVDAIATVVDAVNVTRALTESREAGVQVQHADLLVLNKLDLVADGGQAAAQAVATYNEVAPVLRCSYGEVPWAVLMAPEALAAGKARLPATTSVPSPAQPRAHVHAHAHAPGAPGAFASYTFTRPLDVVFDEAKCEALAFVVPPEIIRFKALLRVDDSAGDWLLIHGVGGRIDLRFLTPPRPPPASVWVFFGQTLDAHDLALRCQKTVRGHKEDTDTSPVA